MRRKNCGGYALIQVLVLIMLILVFLTSMLGAARFRHQAALLRIQKEEAIFAAEAALKLMEADVLAGESRLAEFGMERTETLLEFESEDGEEIVQIPVTVQAKRKENRLILYAEAEVGGRKEGLSVELEYPENIKIATDSNPETATPSNACNKEMIIAESAANERNVQKNFKE